MPTQICAGTPGNLRSYRDPRQCRGRQAQYERLDHLLCWGWRQAGLTGSRALGRSRSITRHTENCEANGPFEVPQNWALQHPFGPRIVLASDQANGGTNPCRRSLSASRLPATRSCWASVALASPALKRLHHFTSDSEKMSSMPDIAQLAGVVVSKLCV